MAYEQLKLSNQLCFPVYATSRLIIREYQPFLDNLGITYPQYLALMVLWENDELSVNDITAKLILNTNTVTPLLQRLEKLGLITRNRSLDDERKVTVKLTEKGKDLQHTAAQIPVKLAEKLLSSPDISLEKLGEFKVTLNQLIDFLSQNKK